MERAAGHLLSRRGSVRNGREYTGAGHATDAEYSGELRPSRHGLSILGFDPRAGGSQAPGLRRPCSVLCGPSLCEDSYRVAELKKICCRTCKINPAGPDPDAYI